MYIRTKDRIEELVYNSEFEYYVTMHTETIISEAHIGMYKTADTIEELCDGFIGITTKEYPDRPDIEPSIHYFNKPFEFEYGNNTFKHLKLIDVELKNQNGWSYPTKEWFETCDIYGFVKTDKGLIYVAKMNENGELVLI